MASRELPFLYQTRTILRLSFHLNDCARNLRHQNPDRQLSTAPSSSSADSTGFFRQKAESSKTRVPRSGKQNTITGEERAAFDKIFRDIRRSGTRLREEDVVATGDADVDHDNILAIFSKSIKNPTLQRRAGYHDPSEPSEDAAPQSSLRDSLNQELILKYPKPLQTAARKAAEAVSGGDKPYRTIVATETVLQQPVESDELFTFKPTQRSEVLRTTPSQHGGSAGYTRLPSLEEVPQMEAAGATTLEQSNRPERPVALLNTRKAIEPQTKNHGKVRPAFVRPSWKVEDTDSAIPTNPSEGSDSLVDTVARREMAKIADALSEASKSKEKAVDFALWEVCQLHIFNMPDVLTSVTTKENQIAMSPSIALHASAAHLGQHSAHATTKSPQSHVSMTLPPLIPPLAIVSRIYPASLLLALRLFAKHCPTSPYALAILPHLRSLGPANYVLGGTAPLYNTLIRLQWDVYSDMRAIDRLLIEMDRGGVESDADTHRALVSIGEDRWKDMNGAEERDTFTRGRAWWERPEQVKWFAKVGIQWRQTVAARLQEQGLGELVSEREYGGGTGSSVTSTRPGFDQGQGQMVWIV